MNDDDELSFVLTILVMLVLAVALVKCIHG